MIVNYLNEIKNEHLDEIKNAGGFSLDIVDKSRELKSPLNSVRDVRKDLVLSVYKDNKINTHTLGVYKFKPCPPENNFFAAPTNMFNSLRRRDQRERIQEYVNNQNWPQVFQIDDNEEGED